MVTIKSVNEAKTGDYITHKGKISIILSVEKKGDYSVIELTRGEIIIAAQDQKIKIFRIEPPSKN